MSCPISKFVSAIGARVSISSLKMVTNLKSADLLNSLIWTRGDFINAIPSVITQGLSFTIVSHLPLVQR